MQSIENNIQWYQSKFEAYEQSMNGEKSSPVHALRREAIDYFVKNGFPTTRQEEWRFINITPISKIEFQPILNYGLNGITKDDIKSYLIDEAIQLVYLNGMFSSELSNIGDLPLGVTIGSLAEAIKHQSAIIESQIASFIKTEANAFTALNTAFIRDGAFISVPKELVLEKPIQLLFVATNNENAFAAQPRNLIIAGDNSQFKVSETYVGLASNKYLTNTVTEIILGKHAIVEHDKMQIESMNAFHVGTISLQMNASSNYLSNAISLGASIARNNITVTMDAEGSECTLNGLSLGTSTQVIDNHTAIDHARPHCNSHELYKSILGGASKGIFNGKIFVRKDAQKTDAKQTNKTLLLSDDATINTKPQLEIFADDVKCTHGATIGQLDADQIFYLRSRGIDFEEVREILTSAFAADVINRITIEPLRRQMELELQLRLNSM